MKKGIIMLALKVTLVAALGYWLIGLLSSSTQPASLPDQVRILSFGDSLTEGVGASVGHDYPTHLARILDRTVTNAGISGETTSGGVKRFATTLEEHQPDIVILLEGGNDFLRNLPEAETIKNLSTMITEAQAQGIQVLLVAVPQKSLFLSDAKLYGELAAQHNVPLLDGALTSLLGSSSNKSDLIHLNDKGYEKLAQAIADKLNGR